MELSRRNPLLSLINEYLIDSPAPINLSYFWGFGSLLGLNLVILIVSCMPLTRSMFWTIGVIIFIAMMATTLISLLGSLQPVK